ncbi:LysR substrate-binding domain-containing protein [Roseobacter weihaiensis]|uniref:LysR substrate-binding domain-containing protein n=1 Tax=Roseobacter weihaiensis TaxID=2763262 RepID=UPI0038737B94
MGIIKPGQGVSFLPEIFAKPLEKSGDLVRVRPDLSGPDVEIFACFPPKRASVPAVRVFIDMLVDFARDRARLDD